MRRTLLGLGILVIAAAPACGPAQPAPVEPKASAAAPGASPPGAPPQAVAGSASFDLSPVAEPPDLVGVARWRSPGATFAAATATAGLPAALADSTSKMAVEQILKEALRGVVDSRQFAQVIQLDAPVDAIMVLDPSPKRKDVLGAVSIGLVSLERAKAAAEASGALAELSPGMWKIGGRERFHATCVIAASGGPTPARLVCSPREKDVIALAPYLVRTLATQAPPQGDAHGELRFAPVMNRYGAELKRQLPQLPAIAESMASIGEPKFDRALKDATVALADEAGALMSDLDKVTLDLGLTPTSGLTATGSLEVHGRKSWLMQTIADRPERAGAPPALFWRAPKDSEGVFFSRNSDPARWAPIAKTLRALLEGAMTKFQVGSKGDREALSALLATQLGKDSNTVAASGHLDSPAARAKPTPQQSLDGLVDSWVGWHLYGVDEGPAALSKYLKDVVAVYNRASLLAPLKKEMRGDAKLLPTVRSVPAPKELGAGALDVEIKVTGIPAEDLPNADRTKDAKTKVTFTAHILLMGDGNTTWLALGTNKDELVKHLLAVKSGGPEAGTISGRAGLDGLKRGTNMAGGFVTLSTLTRSLPRMLEPMAASDPDARRFMQALEGLPHKGETPILISSRSINTGGGRTEMTVNLPKDSIEDLATVGMNLFKASQSRAVAR